MGQQDSNTLHNTSDQGSLQTRSIVEELAAAKKEIRELEMKLKWMERSYE